MPLHFRLPHVNHRACFGSDFFSLTEAKHVMMPVTSIGWCVLDALLDPDGSSQMLARYARFMPTLVTCREAVDRRRTSYLRPMRGATIKDARPLLQPGHAWTHPCPHASVISPGQALMRVRQQHEASSLREVLAGRPCCGATALEPLSNVGPLGRAPSSIMSRAPTVCASFRR